MKNGCLRLRLRLCLCLCLRRCLCLCLCLYLWVRHGPIGVVYKYNSLTPKRDLVRRAAGEPACVWVGGWVGVWVGGWVGEDVDGGSNECVRV